MITIPQEYETISKMGFWFKIEAGLRFSRKA